MHRSTAKCYVQSQVGADKSAFANNRHRRSGSGSLFGWRCAFWRPQSFGEGSDPDTVLVWIVLLKSVGPRRWLERQANYSDEKLDNLLRSGRYL